MSDYSFSALKQQAEVLGLTGDDVAKYVMSQQAAARDERAKERESANREREVQKVNPR